MNTFDNVMVNPIDSEKFQELVKVGEQAFKPFSEMGLVRVDNKTGMLYQFDVALVPFRYKADISIEKVREDAFSMFPDGSVKMSVEDLEREGLLLPPVTIAEYIKDRRGYNARIRDNERIITDWLNEN